MYAVTDGALRTAAWSAAANEFFTEGFECIAEPVPVGKFVLISLRDVTESPFFGYHWELSAAIVIATDPFGPYHRQLDGTVEGAAVLAQWKPRHADTINAVQHQAAHVLAWALGQDPQTVVPAETRARHQMAVAEYHWHKARDARQGVADRLWRDRLLDGASTQTRADMSEWIDEFGQRPMPLRNEESAHEQMQFRRWLTRPR